MDRDVKDKTQYRLGNIKRVAVKLHHDGYYMSERKIRDELEVLIREAQILQGELFRAENQEKLSASNQNGDTV